MNQQPILPAAPADARGVVTGVPLDRLARLCLPGTPDGFGRLRPPPDRTAMRLSLELAYMTYTLDLAPWMRAGWMDISIQVDNHLQSGVTVGTSESATSERIRGLMNAWKVARARMALREANPVAQIMGALRQREGSDTIKAVTMMHPLPGGRFAVAIGFMGTGSRFYDWFSNFRFTTEAGFHKGFYQLTQVFAESAERIQFPATARALGLEKLTLADVLAEMRDPRSRFHLWMAGHSQGAAVMQVFCHRLVTDQGVLPRHIIGYGFASPTTVVADAAFDPGAYPLYHVLNSDDLVPLIGARMHLGVCLRYQADDALRAATYGWPEDAAEVAARAAAETVFGHIQDTPTMLTALAALMTLLQQEKTDDALAALMDRPWSIAPLDKAFAFAGGRMKEQLHRMVRYARIAYHALTGQKMDREAVARIMEAMRPAIRDYPLRRLLAAARDRYHPPHMLRRAHGALGAYGYIALEGSERLSAAVWALDAQGEPVCRALPGYVRFTPEPDAEPSVPERPRRASRSRARRPAHLHRRRPTLVLAPAQTRRVFRAAGAHTGFWHFPWRKRAAQG